MRRLGPKDYVLLAVISAATVIGLAALAEVSARALFEEISDACTTATGLMPNCTSLQKIAEGPAVINHYNECGYRTAASCGVKPDNTIRVAVLGTSISRGYAVAYDEFFAARSAAELTKRCRRSVEFQTVSVMWDQFDRSVDEAFRLRPDVVLLMFGPWDIWKYPAVWSGGQPSLPPRKYERLPFYQTLHPIAKYLRDLREESRAVLILRHLIYEDRDTFVRLYLTKGDESDYLRTPFTDAWRQRLEFVDSLIDGLSQKAADQHIPVMVAFVPLAPYVLLASSRSAEPGINPFALDRAIQAMTTSHHAQYIDILKPMSRMPQPTDMYYSVNGHPNGAGHAVIASAVGSELLKNISFKDCGQVRNVNRIDVQ